MSVGPASVDDRFAGLVERCLALPGVTPPAGGGGFGRSALRVNRRIFAMLVRGRLVLKLPAERVAELIVNGDGAAFDANKGMPMREWVALDPATRLDWFDLASEAWRYGSGSAG